MIQLCNSRLNKDFRIILVEFIFFFLKDLHILKLHFWIFFSPIFVNLSDFWMHAHYFFWFTMWSERSFHRFLAVTILGVAH